MKNIFIGFILIFLDFNLNAGNIQIELIPDFIGYILMLRGLDEMSVESKFFMKIKPYVTGMAIYTAILYLLDLIGFSKTLGVFTYVLALLSIIVFLYISYHIVIGVKDIEGKYNISMNGDQLKSSWTLLAIFNVLTYVSLLIPSLAIICIIVSFIAAIYFLVVFNKSKNLYYEAK